VQHPAQLFRARGHDEFYRARLCHGKMELPLLQRVKKWRSLSARCRTGLVFQAGK